MGVFLPFTPIQFILPRSQICSSEVVASHPSNCIVLLPIPLFTIDGNDDKNNDVAPPYTLLLLWCMVFTSPWWWWADTESVAHAEDAVSGQAAHSPWKWQGCSMAEASIFPSFLCWVLHILFNQISYCYNYITWQWDGLHPLPICEKPPEKTTHSPSSTQSLYQFVTSMLITNTCTHFYLCRLYLVPPNPHTIRKLSMSSFSLCY